MKERKREDLIGQQGSVTRRIEVGPLSIDWTHKIERITQLNETYVRIEWA
ncbi:Uncharacterised protein [Paenibacillus thiaminolyticus]|nr:Uncharacterised protein [Paenibacillus thiaminolyticus]